MEIYIIIAVSFAIMYTINYIYQINLTVLSTLYMFDIDYSETDWNPWSFVIGGFIVSVMLMPIIVLFILPENRWKVINKSSKYIINKHFSKYFKK